MMAKSNRRAKPWQLTKQLTVDRLEMRHRMTGKYTLGLRLPDQGPGEESTLTLTADDLIRYRLDPNEALVGAQVALTLTALPPDSERRQPGVVTFKRLTAERVTQHYTSVRPPEKSEKQTYHFQLATPVGRGSIVVLPDTYLELDLMLTEGEYRHVRQLPAGTVFTVQLRRVNQPFRDLTLTWSGALDDPRLFPADYSPRMIALAHAMLAVFDGDVDVVCHACGLETTVEETEDETWPSVRRWQREYFAADVYEPDAWETPYAERVAAVEAILTERYGNRLGLGSVHCFDDLLEASTWMRKRAHPVDEVTVGLRVGNVTRGGVYLPSIVIEARSVGGNRKACEAVCAKLAEEASRLFGVKVDQWAVAENGVSNKDAAED